MRHTIEIRSTSRFSSKQKLILMLFQRSATLLFMPVVFHLIPQRITLINSKSFCLIMEQTLMRRLKKAELLSWCCLAVIKVIKSLILSLYQCFSSSEKLILKFKIRSNQTFFKKHAMLGQQFLLWVWLKRTNLFSVKKMLLATLRFHLLLMKIMKIYASSCFKMIKMYLIFKFGMTIRIILSVSSNSQRSGNNQSFQRKFMNKFWKWMKKEWVGKNWKTIK